MWASLSPSAYSGAFLTHLAREAQSLHNSSCWLVLLGTQDTGWPPRVDMALAELCLWKVLSRTCLEGMGTSLLPPPALNCSARHQLGWASLVMMSVSGEGSWPPAAHEAPALGSARRPRVFPGV